MMKDNAKFLTILFLVLECVVFAPGRCTGQDSSETLPDDVRDALQRQAAALESVFLKYTETQSGIDVPEYYGGPTDYTAAFDRNQFHLKTEYRYKNKGGDTTVHEDAFDGAFFFYGDPKDDPGVLKKYLPTDSTDPELSTPLYFRYLDAAGFSVPQFIADLPTYRAIQSLPLLYIKQSDSTKVEKINEGYRVTVHIPDPLIIRARETDLKRARENMEDGQLPPKQIIKRIDDLEQMQNMEKYRTVNFILDSRYGYAVVEREDFTASGQLILRLKCDQWKHDKDNNVWLPQRCTETYYSRRFSLADFSKEPRLLVTYELKEISFGKPQGIQYTLDYTEPGSVIIDRSSPEARSSPEHEVAYTVAADGTRLQGIVALEAPPKKKRISVFWFSLYIILLAFPILFFWLRRHKERKQNIE